MKRYVRPMMDAQMFVANEYVAACWLIYCDGPRLYEAEIWNETNGVSGLQTSTTNGIQPDTKVRDYYKFWGDVGGCGSYHKGIISDKTPAVNGYWTGINLQNEKVTYEVFWWQDKVAGADSYHVSLLDNKTPPKTNPNAS